MNIEDISMKIRNSYKCVFLLIVGFSFFGAGCATFEVGIETTNTGVPSVTNEPIEESSTPTVASQPTETAVPLEPSVPVFPELVTVGNLTPYASSDTGVLVLQDGELTAQPSPVYHEVFWEYTPVTGQLAYSPEFVHGSDHNNVSVTSLWVYDYETGASELWLDDNVIRAAWTPDGEKVTAAVYNPDTEQIDLVFVTGPNQVEMIAECASQLFSWSPDGSQLAYVNAIFWAGVKPACAGTFLVSFPNGISSPDREITRVSDFGSESLMSGDYNDKPIWAVDNNSLIYPDQPFWVVPLDGSAAFIPATPDGQDPLELPRLLGSFFAPDLSQLVGYYEIGMSGQGGVWVYQLSDDLLKIEEYYRIGNVPQEDNSDMVLVDWWVPGESILVLDGDNFEPSEFLNELWRAPAVWLLDERQWGSYPH
jgi:hypothetical protein